MTVPRSSNLALPSPATRAALLAAGPASLAVVLGLVVWLVPAAPDQGIVLTFQTVRLALAWYAAAMLLMTGAKADDWRVLTARGRAMRWCWTWGMTIYLVHVGMAFHHYHGWSHADAFRRTREISGLGAGLYVSYLFTLVWTLDGVWWWLSPQSHAGRPAWLGKWIHGFMLLIVFNGLVVFGTSPARWIGAAAFVLAGLMWLRSVASKPGVDG